jgi:glycosyltransferase involved in cell wall biosynthesis
MKYRLGILVTHPIQYYAPWYRALAAHPEVDLEVFFAHKQSAQDQAKAGYGVAFEWDVPLLEGYANRFLKNVAKHPSIAHFLGCDTPEIKDIIRERRFDAFIVQGWNIKAYWQAINACRKAGTPVLVRGDSHLHTRRSWMLRVLKYGLYRWFIPRFDAYLPVGTWNREYYLHYGADSKRMFRVPHAVDNEFFAQRAETLLPQKASLREQTGFPADAIVFVFAGRLVNAKRPMDFLRAMKEISEHHSNIWGLVVGDGALRAAMESFVRRHHLPIRFLGFMNQSEIPHAYVMADALVLPSRVAETWGLVVNEAMACGLPALVSDGVGCAPDLVEEGQTGHIFAAEDVSALAKLMIRLADHPGTLQQMKRNVQARVQDFSIDKAVQGTIEALHFFDKSG